MKRIELLKKTGICFTALTMSAFIGMSAPITTALASEEPVAAEEAPQEEPSRKKTLTTKKAAEEQTEEPSVEKDEGGSGGDGGNGDGGSGENPGSGGGESGDSGDSGSGDSGSGGSESGSGDSGSGGGESGSGDSGSGGGESGDSGDTSGSGGGESGGSGDTSGSGSSDSGSGETSGDSSSGTGGTSSGSGAGNTGSSSSSGTGETSSGSGTGNTGSGSSGAGGTTDPGAITIPIDDPSQLDPGAGNTTVPGTGQTPVTDPNATTPTTTDPNTVQPVQPGDLVLPQLPTRTKKNGTLKDKATQLNPGEVPTGYQDALQYTGTNEQLIQSQNIVSGLSIIRDDFRFFTVEKNLAFSTIAQGIHEEMKSASRQVGILSENDALYILSEEKDGWLYVESGNVRGFIKSTAVLRDDAAAVMLDDLQEKLDTLAYLSGEDAPDASTMLQFAKESVPAQDNAAFTYKRSTTKSTVVDKQYAVADTEAPVLEAMTDDARPVGQLTPGDLCYVIMQVDNHWAYVESGNVRGFTPISNLTTGKDGKKIVQSNGEANMEMAEQLVDPSENAALYYTFNSVQDGVAYNNIRSEIVEIASECIGNPYVWGGNSLTYGADCSGFVKTLYSMFGYEIPRVADAQSRFGTQIPVSDAAPGDLIFFAENGYVYHVAMYAGDGMTIEAYSEDRGIIATDIGNRNAVWATRIIED